MSWTDKKVESVVDAANRIAKDIGSTFTGEDTASVMTALAIVVEHMIRHTDTTYKDFNELVTVIKKMKDSQGNVGSLTEEPIDGGESCKN